MKNKLLKPAALVSTLVIGFILPALGNEKEPLNNATIICEYFKWTCQGGTDGAGGSGHGGDTPTTRGAGGSGHGGPGSGPSEKPD